jgi:hypothetical protein
VCGCPQLAQSNVKHPRNHLSYRLILWLRLTRHKFTAGRSQCVTIKSIPRFNRYSYLQGKEVARQPKFASALPLGNNVSRIQVEW